MDEKELQDRLKATQTYMEEDEKHFVDYAYACREESFNSSRSIRNTWDETWSAYRNEMDFSMKDDWQAQISLNRPFTTVQQAKSIVRKSLVETPDFFSIEALPAGSKEHAKYLESIGKFWLDNQHGKYTTMFPDASEMAFAVGQSMEIIPVFDEQGFRFVLIEPWKIFRDPDALSRDPYSGLYWIHEEWTDWWMIKEQEKQGIFYDVNRIKNSGDRRNIDRQESDKRREHTWDRSKFRKSILATDFWGTILNRDSELLLHNGNYVVAGENIIRKPRLSPYVNLRWPGISFSPFPDPLRYEGRGIIEGVLHLWILMNNLLCMFSDDMSWVVNSLREVDQDLLADGANFHIKPGETLIKKPGYQGQPAVTEINKASKTIDVLPFLQQIDRYWQNGSFVSEILEGMPGSRSRVTKGEIEIKNESAMGIFDSIVHNIEPAAVQTIWAALEVIMLNWDITDEPSPIDIFGVEVPLDVLLDMEYRKNMLKDFAKVTVSGISNLVKRNELLQKIVAVMQWTGNPVFAPYFEPYNILKAAIDTIGLSDKHVIKTEAEMMGGIRNMNTQPLSAERAGLSAQAGLTTDNNAQETMVADPRAMMGQPNQMDENPYMIQEQGGQA